MNPLTREEQARRRHGLPILDWTVSNPTTCGFEYPARDIREALINPAFLRYNPDPRGMQPARVAIADWYGRHGVPVQPDNLLLTSGSSEAYSFLLRIFCNPGDEIAIPKPGYPLFDDLARLNDVTTTHYRLRYDGFWHLDAEDLRQSLTGKTRALVVVHPNNPTGNFLTPGERDIILSTAVSRRIPLIVDEVFFSFAFEHGEPRRSFCGSDVPLVIVLNGLSKLAALPQMKLGWVVVGGTETGLVQDTLARLEMIADTYLSVNTPVQVALPRLLETASHVGEQLRTRAALNYRELRKRFDGTPISALRTEAGWNTILRLPGVRSDEEWALELLREEGLLVYPAYLFELEIAAGVVVSLLPEPEKVKRYAQILLESVARGGTKSA